MTTLPDDLVLLQEVTRQAGMRRQPINGTFELTHRCNLGCHMCYVRHPAGDPKQKEREMSSTGWLELARQSVEMGLLSLLITGGEIFLRPDFFEIYEPLTRMGLLITLFTNGTLITQPIAKRLSQSPPNNIEITLYGATEKTYEAVTRVRGSYARCCAGIEEILKSGIQLTLKSTITQQNASEIEAMEQMARNWGVPYFNGWLLFPRHDGGDSDLNTCRLPTSECIKLESSNSELLAKWNNISKTEPDADSHKNFYCMAGKTSFLINPAGKMNACVELPRPVLPTTEMGFSVAWQKLQEFVDTAPELSSVCHACDAIEFCTRCPAWSNKENGTLNAPVPYLCEIAFARKKHYQPK